MREAKIILPLSCDSLSETLVEAFGGCTVTTGHGCWKHPVTGKVIAEPVRVYTVAVGWYPGVLCEANTKVLRALRDIARAACIAGRQECVYLECPDGEVKLVNQEGRNVET